MTNSALSHASHWASVTYSSLLRAENAALAPSMAAYMKGHFAFLGIPKPFRAEIQRRHWAARPRKSDAIACIHELWMQPFREAQYLACGLLKAESKYWAPTESLNALEYWITTKSWWDSVDTLAVHGVGVLLRRHPEAGWPVVQQWIYAENMWLNRTAMICQLGFRGETRTEWLDEALSAHVHSTEFFHRKAIGWALRDYGKTNPRWVRQWVDAHPELSGLSRREALRLLGSREEA
jgi:3-methyladenine DNA glycosylase AlkD